MIKSMTGYGRGNLVFDGREYTVEIRTVNHRYNDITIKMPRYLNFLEDRLKQLIMKYVSRGKTEVYVSLNDFSKDSRNIKIDESLLEMYFSEMKRVAEKNNITNDITITSLMKLPDVIVVENNVDEDSCWEELRQCAGIALASLKEAREKEGENLKKDILERLNTVEMNVNKMEQNSNGLVDEYRKRLQLRLKELNVDSNIEENRIAMEVVLFADKSSICEEITRLKSHITAFRDFLNVGDIIGKKLDFLLQEMNREVNTIASKANCISITNEVVATKNEIENIREQVQNIE